jgi:predicted AlkP superfamily pyrophosphatase or phosphodiesterase
MKRLLHPLLLVLLIGCTSIVAGQQRPKLVVLLSIDQMRGDYLDRFGSDFTGGFKRLASEGVVFTNAHLDYAASETGPGHATISTGSYPRTNGIVGNEWIDPITRKEVYCVADSTALPVEGLGGGSSPKNLLVTGVGDWLKSASPASRVFSTSIKDRAAILMGGKQPDAAYWFDAEGRVVTSSYYTKSLPPSVKNFNASAWIERNVPNAWTKLLHDSVYNRFGPDEFEGEGLWNGKTTFPHEFHPARKASHMRTSPYGDLMTLAFAEELIKGEELGKREATDVLAVSLSCTDYVGHHYGPNSHEIHDHLIRLDRALGTFFEFLESYVGKKNVLVAFSADHGVCPLPEWSARMDGKKARRLNTTTVVRPAFERELDKVKQEWGIGEPLVEHNAFFNYRAASKTNIDSTTLEQRVRQALLQVDGIADVYLRRELLDPSTPDRPYLARFRKSYLPSRGEDFQIRAEEFSLLTSRNAGSTHGSCYAYDSHVPLVFWRSGLKPSRVNEEARVIDLAPTIAKLLGIPTPKTVDGRVLPDVR